MSPEFTDSVLNIFTFAFLGVLIYLYLHRSRR